MDWRETDDEQESSGELEEGHMAHINIVGEGAIKHDIEEHMATHVLFRSWCPFCVAGQP